MRLHSSPILFFENYDSKTEVGKVSFCFCFVSAVKGQTVNILGFVTHTVSVATTHLCYSSKKAAIHSIFKNKCSCVLKTKKKKVKNCCIHKNKQLSRFGLWALACSPLSLKERERTMYLGLHQLLALCEMWPPPENTLFFQDSHT